MPVIRCLFRSLRRLQTRLSSLSQQRDGSPQKSRTDGISTSFASLAGASSGQCRLHRRRVAVVGVLLAAAALVSFVEVALVIDSGLLMRGRGDEHLLRSISNDDCGRGSMPRGTQIRANFDDAEASELAQKKRFTLDYNRFGATLSALFSSISLHSAEDSALSEVLRTTNLVRRFCHRASVEQRHPETSYEASVNSTSGDAVRTTQLASALLFLQHLLIDERHSVAYCDVPKVASTTVKEALATMTGRLDSDARHASRQRPRHSVPVHSPKFMASIGLSRLGDSRTRKRVKSAANRDASASSHRGNASLPVPALPVSLGCVQVTNVEAEIQSIIDDARLNNDRYRKLIVVRHPLSRVVSAYRDKFTRHNRWTKYFHRKYGRLIVSRYRDPSSAGNDSDTKTTNAESGSDVTFAEFVRFLIDDAPEIRIFKTNPHWQPITDLCRPCDVDYDYVVRIESFQPEIMAVWSELFPENASSPTSRSVLARRHNSGPDEGNDRILSSDTTSGGDTVTSKYLRQLSREQLCRLVDVYREDFETFGYQQTVADGCSDLLNFATTSIAS